MTKFFKTISLALIMIVSLTFFSCSNNTDEVDTTTKASSNFKARMAGNNISQPMGISTAPQQTSASLIFQNNTAVSWNVGPILVAKGATGANAQLQVNNKMFPSFTIAPSETVTFYDYVNSSSTVTANNVNVQYPKWQTPLGDYTSAAQTLSTYGITLPMYPTTVMFAYWTGVNLSIPGFSPSLPAIGRSGFWTANYSSSLILPTSVSLSSGTTTVNATWSQLPNGDSKVTLN
ncbi:MAG: hypothetical protein H7174_14200 [Flavobacterium sp.]|nr:hypothetical protein [Flavobacterium sp.]